MRNRAYVMFWNLSRSWCSVKLQNDTFRNVAHSCIFEFCQILFVVFFVEYRVVICMDVSKYCSCGICRFKHVLAFVKCRDVDFNECYNFVCFQALWNYKNPTVGEQSNLWFGKYCETEVFVNSRILRIWHYCGRVKNMNLCWAWGDAMSKLHDCYNLRILEIYWNSRKYETRKCEHPNAAKTKQGTRFRYIQRWRVVESELKHPAEMRSNTAKVA